MEKRRPGTPSKGDRSAITARVPTPHRDVYELAASNCGMPLSDYIALCMAQLHQLDEPDYVYRNRNQAELPLGA